MDITPMTKRDYKDFLKIDALKEESELLEIARLLKMTKVDITDFIEAISIIKSENNKHIKLINEKL